MSTELKQAAQQALDAFDDFGDADDFAAMFALTQKMNALRTAIQQAEVKTDEPVAWGWAIVDNKGLERRTRARIQDFFGSNQEAKPFSLEDVAREDREFAGCAPHHVITLFTHPAPGVTDDVVRKAEQMRFILRAADDMTTSRYKSLCELLHVEVTDAFDLGAAIDAANPPTQQPKEPS